MANFLSRADFGKFLEFDFWVKKCYIWMFYKSTLEENMQNADWLIAARKYQERATEEAEQPEKSVTTVKPPLQSNTHTGSTATEIANALRKFILSEEGTSAKILLQASKQYVILEEEYDGGGYGSVYFLDGEGYKVSFEAMGTWQIYARTGSTKEPKVSLVAEFNLACAIVRQSEGQASAEGLLNFVIRKLDAIAADADK
jgi:hypothetical protein